MERYFGHMLAFPMDCESFSMADKSVSHSFEVKLGLNNMTGASIANLSQIFKKILSASLQFSGILLVEIPKGSCFC